MKVMKSRQTFITLLSLLCLLKGALAAAAPPEFSADIYQKDPKGNETVGRLFNGSGKTRVEMTQNGQAMVQITDSGTGVMWMILPSQRSYMERRGAPAGERSAGASPCQGNPALTCTKGGEEQISGRPAIKWEMTSKHQGKTMRGTQWVDAERGMVLKQVMPNGMRSELKMLASDQVGGRPVEKWEMIIEQGNRGTQRLLQWYDPELKLVLREVFPGGYVREIRNIEIGPQDASLFSLPAGYKKVKPQQRMPAPQQ